MALADRVRFVSGCAKDIAERDFDLVTMFDCLHDMSDPLGCAKHIRKLLKPDGTWMIVEPIAADHPAENVGNPVSRRYYNASTMICVPTSLAQEVGEALGAQAGEVKSTEIVRKGGFRTCGVPPKAPSIWCWKLGLEIWLQIACESVSGY